IEINGAGALTLRLNPFYRQALARTDRDAPALAPADRENLRNQVRRARLFIETVRRRTWTLYSCVEHIVEVQRAFLDRGPAHLVPLTMSAVAQALTISESTVSRALDAKYVQMPNGRIVSFEIFFDQSTPVKERIKTIIAAEETSRPLTDAEIAKTLATEGFPVARRTVAKYREELRLPAWRHRQRSRAAH
ncbi:MAG: RNA polymerase sigma-54 factor, partial [Armatimonadetes bacterium]|nr:RNA polymerase sigma-54 factor [Armatimonadota bacterium]